MTKLEIQSKEYYEGKTAAYAYYYSQGYSSLTRNVRPEDAMRLFLPPVEESLTQIAMPLPASRQDWLKGFAEKQKEILEKLNV